jgi:SAM-dependent methyltransferase
MENQSRDIYDYPQYYDLVYGSDWQDEFNFLLGCFDRYASAPVKRVFEPACGTGRLLLRLARAGFNVSGLDINKKSVDYCNKRLKRNGFSESVIVGDMSSFVLPSRVDAAFNLINSFRHLVTEQAARQHLRCIVDALSDGGLYVVGLYLTPTIGEASVKESWSGKRGRLKVTSRVWTAQRHRHRRQEQCAMTYDVKTPTGRFRVSAQMVWRTYSLDQFHKLIRQIPEFEIAAVFDFSYELDTPIIPTASTHDAVFILRKKQPA